METQAGFDEIAGRSSSNQRRALPRRECVSSSAVNLVNGRWSVSDVIFSYPTERWENALTTPRSAAPRQPEIFRGSRVAFPQRRVRVSFRMRRIFSARVVAGRRRTHVVMAAARKPISCATMRAELLFQSGDASRPLEVTTAHESLPFNSGRPTPRPSDVGCERAHSPHRAVPMR